MKKDSYFKRIKQPVKTSLEAEPLKKETKLYLFLCIAVSLIAGIAGVYLPDNILLLLSQVVIVAGVFGAIYFGIILVAMSHVSQCLDNLTCPRCHNSLANLDYATWEEVSRHWRSSKNQARIDGRMYVTVQFTCTCPHCGETKCFTETLSSGRIAVRGHISHADMTLTKKLVEDYFNGVIHK